MLEARCRWTTPAVISDVKNIARSELWVPAILSVLVVVTGCGTACKCRRTDAVDLTSATERAYIFGREYVLSARAAREYGPESPPDGPLVVSLTATSLDSLPLPYDLEFDHLWVINGAEQWSKELRKSRGDLRSDQGFTSVGYSAAYGPKWDTGTKVDVIVRLRLGHLTALVKASGVEIGRWE